MPVAIAVIMRPGWFRRTFAELYPLEANPSNGYPFNFPGDAPLFEVLLYVATPLFLLGVAFVVTSVVLERKAARYALLALGLFPLLFGGWTIAYATYGIAQRHVGDMGRLKAALTEASAQVHARTGGRRLERGESDLLDKELLDPRPTLLLKGGQQPPVTIRIMQTGPPYVGADFGRGSSAVFDLTTMWCTYSD